MRTSLPYRQVGTVHASLRRASLQTDADRIKAMADQAIAACGGDARDTVKALLVANEFLEAEIKELRAAVSSGFTRGYSYGRFKTYSG